MTVTRSVTLEYFFKALASYYFEEYCDEYMLEICEVESDYNQQPETLFGLPITEEEYKKYKNADPVDIRQFIFENIDRLEQY